MSYALAEYLNEDTIELQVTVANWEEALRRGGQLLVNVGSVEPEYLDAMIDMINELGPYVVIAPGLALGHARPDAGVNRTCFSLITLAEPVEFGVPSNDPIDIVFSFAATDKNAHIDAIRELALLCREEENMRKIRSATKVDEILALL